MEFQKSFFEDEVRDGFYVPAMVKRAWGAELEVLNEIDRICRKYDIRYFAEWGSLLGAVRHEGFIPWDDDLDICMKRKDYKRFLEVADKELKADLKVFTYERHPNFWYFLARVVAKPTICFEKEHLDKFHQFPYIVGVDIFVLDYVSADEEKEKDRIKKSRFVIEAADEICTKELHADTIEKYLSAIEELCSVKIPQELKFYNYKKANSLGEKRNCLELSFEERKHKLRVFLYKLAENLFDMLDENEAEFLAQMMPNVLYGNGGKIPKAYYDDIIRLPFENTTMPVPMAYDTMLKKKYGDYMRLIKSTGGHNYPFFESQQKQLDDILQKEGIVFSKEFKFDKTDVERLVSERSNAKENSYKALLEVCGKELFAMQENIRQFIEDNRIDDVLDMLGAIQQLAIDMGTMIESCKGEGFTTVNYLQEYCEYIFRLYESILNNLFDNKYLEDLVEALQKVKISLDKDVLERKEVVFILSHIDKWKYFKDTYNRFVNDENCDVYVMVIPYYYKDFDGTLRDMQYEADLLNEKINLVKYDEYDFGLRYPEMIFIQNPYDEYNPVFTEHTFFYSSNIRKYTDKLVYVSTFEIEDFRKENCREYLNMKYYCTVPGVVNADKVFLISENLKDIYIEKLTEFAGEDTRDIWEEKLVSLNCEYNEENVAVIPDNWKTLWDELNVSDKKVILYHTGISAWIECKEKMACKLRDVLKIFYENRDDVCLIWYPHKMTEEILKEKLPDVYCEYMKIVDEYKNEEWGIFCVNEDEDKVVSLCDAYYGDSAPIVRKFRNKHRPVMIQGVEIL